jgi:hypothetical protein
VLLCTTNDDSKLVETDPDLKLCASTKDLVPNLRKRQVAQNKQSKSKTLNMSIIKMKIENITIASKFTEEHLM